MTYTCPFCNKKNRLPDVPRKDGKYECGACKAPLVPFPRSTDREATASSDVQTYRLPTNSGHINRPSSAYRIYASILIAAAVGGSFFIWRDVEHQHGTTAVEARLSSTASSPVFQYASAKVSNLNNNSIPAPSRKEFLKSHISDNPVRLLPPSPQPPLSTALENGTILIQAQRQQGLGSLTIINGNDEDAVVKIVSVSSPISNNKGPYSEIYVCAQKNATIYHIAPGRYRLKFSSGSDWDTQHNQFRSDRHNSVLDKLMSFDEVTDQTGIHYSAQQVTLHSVVNGNIHSTNISDDDFSEN